MSEESDDGEQLVPADIRAVWDDRMYAATVDELNDEPDRAADGSGEQSIQERMDHERIEEMREARDYRRQVVTFTRWVVGGLVIAATAFMGVYMGSQWHHVEAAVVIAYFTSVVVESIGILYVISRYLFPDGARPRDQ